MEVAAPVPENWCDSPVLPFGVNLNPGCTNLSIACDGGRRACKLLHHVGMLPPASEF